MSYIIENSAQFFWLLWTFIWHSLWVIILGMFLDALFKTLQGEEKISWNHFPTFFQKKSRFFLISNLLIWRFLGFKPLIFLWAGFVLLMAWFWLLKISNLRGLQNIKKINYKIFTEAWINFYKKLKKWGVYFLSATKDNIAKRGFWQEIARNIKESLWKIKTKYGWALLVVAILGGFIPASYWLKFIYFPSLWETFLQNMLVGFGIGLILPFLFLIKLPFGIYLWNIGFPPASVFAYFAASFLSPFFIKKHYLKLDLKATLMYVLKIVTGTILGAAFIQLLAKTLSWSFLHQVTLLQKEIAFDATFWLNSAAVLFIIGAILIADKPQSVSKSF